MTGRDAYISPNSAEVAAKVMDGEAILINLSNGMYYSMDLAGGLVWSLIEVHSRFSEIVDALCAHYEVERPQADADLEALVERLLEARLIVVSEVRSADAPQNTAAPAADTRLAYHAPTLNAYHDMSELLALDPPHPSLTDTLSNHLVES